MKSCKSSLFKQILCTALVFQTFYGFEFAYAQDFLPEADMGKIGYPAPRSLQEIIKNSASPTAVAPIVTAATTVSPTPAPSPTLVSAQPTTDYSTYASDSEITNKRCDKGKHYERFADAVIAFDTLSGATETDRKTLGDNYLISDLSKNIKNFNSTGFYLALGALVLKGMNNPKQSCAFDEKAQFDTIGHVVDAITNHLWLRKKIVPLPSFIKPGFEAALFGYDSNDYILMIAGDKINGTPVDGFTFYYCTSLGLTPIDPDITDPTKCKTSFNRVVYIPYDQFIDGIHDIKHYLLIALKALGQVSVLFFAGAGSSGIFSSSSQDVSLVFSLISLGAQVGSSFTDPKESVNSLVNSMRISRTFSDVNNFAHHTEDGVAIDEAYVARMYEFHIADIQTALDEIVHSKVTTFIGEDKSQVDKSLHNPSYKTNPADAGSGKVGINYQNKLHDIMIPMFQKANGISVPQAAPKPATTPNK